VSSLLIGTANVLRSLGPADAGAAVDGLLEHRPHLIGLQEWGPRRSALLQHRGDARLLVPGGLVAGGLVAGGLRPGRLLLRRGGAGPGGYTWLTAVVGGCAVGARSDRLEPSRAALRLLSGPGRADPGSRDVPVRPPRFAVVATYRDLEQGGTVTLVNYHLMPAVQRRGRYHPARPLLVGAHRQEVRALNRIVREHLRLGHVVYAVGDSNFHGLRLDGLTSAWEGREDRPGTFGRRKIDDVHGPGPAECVALLTNASDHKALLARFPSGQHTGAP
jgi:hypothetical protein